MPFVNSKPYRVAGDNRLFETQNSVGRALDWVLVAFLCLLLAVGPLAFGAVQEWATCILEIGAAVCVSLWAGRALAYGRLEFHGNALFLPIMLFAMLVCAQLVSGHTAYWFVTWQNALLWAAY